MSSLNVHPVFKSPSYTIVQRSPRLNKHHFKVTQTAPMWPRWRHCQFSLSPCGLHLAAILKFTQKTLHPMLFLMLGHCLRRWSNIKTTLVVRLMLSCICLPSYLSIIAQLSLLSYHSNATFVYHGRYLGKQRSLRWINIIPRLSNL